MPSNPTYTVSQICDALKQANGNLSVAAHNLGCTRGTIYNRAQTSQKIADTIAEARETQIDFAEGKLIGLVRDGNLGAICFFLKTQAKHRGYVEKVDHVNINHNTHEFDQSQLNQLQADIIANMYEGD